MKPAERFERLVAWVRNMTQTSGARGDVSSAETQLRELVAELDTENVALPLALPENKAELAAMESRITRFQKGD